MDQPASHTEEEGVYEGFEDGGDTEDVADWDHNPENGIIMNSMSATRFTMHVSSIVKIPLSFSVTVEDVLLRKVSGGNFGQSITRVHNSRKLQATKS